MIGNLPIFLGGSGGAVISVSYVQLTAIIDSNELAVGSTYKLTDADSSLYGGTTIYLKALTTNKLSDTGTDYLLIQNT